MQKKSSKKIFEQSIEAGVHMYLDTFQTLQQTELDAFSQHAKEMGNDNIYNIYFILKRPKISYDESTTVVNDDNIEIGYKVLLGEKYVNRMVLFENPIGKKKGLNIVSPYPYNYILIRDKKKPLILLKLSVLVDESHRINRIKDDLLDFEILYIGQAFGKNGKRTALNRLTSHETLQTIYSHAIAHYPSSDIWFMLSSFQQVTFTFSGNLIPTKETNHEKDYERLMKFIGSDGRGVHFSEQQKINFTEAALIRFFQPVYNIEYKTTFPNYSHKSYKECYDADINAISIEVNTSDMRRRLFTKHVKPKYSHQHRFYMHNTEDRVKMFELDWLKKGK